MEAKKSHIKLFIYMFSLVLIKLWLVSSLSISAYSHATFDDRLGVNQAFSLLNGEWLGEYNVLTLVKGMVFPAFLALCNFLSIPYLFGLTIFYSLSVYTFMVSIKKIVPNNLFYGTIYTILLFNPATMSNILLQRVYRNSLALGQTLFLFACIFGIYLNKNESFKKLIPWSIGLGISFWSIWNTREDGIWVVPVIAVSTIITLLSIMNTKKNIIFWRKYVFALILPFIIFFIGNISLCAMNYHYYGIFTTNEFNDSEFTNMVKSLYSVNPEQEIDFVAVPRDTIKKLYTVSPTLKSVENDIENSLDSFEPNGKVKGDMEVDNGWFLWALRDAISNAGYYTNAQTANAFCEQVSKEINMALKNKELNKRKTMPSPLMVPWKTTYLTDMITKIPQTVKLIVNYEDINIGVRDSYGDGSNGIRLFEIMTNNLALAPITNVLELSGWIFSKIDTETVELTIIDSSGRTLSNLPLQKSPDVFEYFHKEGNDFFNANNSRFSINLSLDNNVIFPLKLKVANQSGKLIEIPLAENNLSFQDIVFNFDNNSIKSTTPDVDTNISKLKITIINSITKFYQLINPSIVLVSILIYIFITLIFIKNIKKAANPVLVEWLFLTAILGTFLILCFGVTYTDISSYFAISSLYLSGAYSLMLSFEAICLIGGNKVINTLFKNKF